MPREISGFRSRSDDLKDEALCGRYGRIGIPAVAAAQTAKNHCTSGDRQILRVASTADVRRK